jgi:hypothetical protein
VSWIMAIPLLRVGSLYSASDQPTPRQEDSHDQ